MEELGEYLRSRHVPEEDIERMEQDKIDPSVIKLMTDEELKEYLPSYGDRVAVFGYCRRREPESSSRKSKLFERLKGKLTNRNPKDSVVNKEHPNSNAKKSERKIELGWLHFRDKDKSYVQMRTKKGGGTRKESVSKDSTRKDLIERAAQLFFPGGTNLEGNISEFELDLTDFQANPLEDDVTVGELYERVKLPVLRFYLKTKKREVATKVNLENTEVQPVNFTDHSDMSLQPSDSLTATSLELNNLDVVYIGSSTVFVSSNDEPFQAVANPVNSLPDQETILNVYDMEDSGIVTFHTEGTSEVVTLLDDTLPLTEDLSLPPVMDVPEKEKTIVVVHRGQIVKQLIQVFSEEKIMNENVSFKVILPDGTMEKAVDDGGVLRDVLSEFWDDFYEQCTMGNDFKVPYLRHDFGKEEWESVGRIISFGWKKEQHLPIKLAPVVLEQAALGVTESDLLKSFFKYVSHSERTMFETCMSDFESIDKEELLEVLDLHSCRRHPTASNIEQILTELAHQKLIQEPAFVIEQWSNVFALNPPELKGISAAYDALQPTSRKVIHSVTYPSNLNALEKQIGKYLTTYLRESDTVHLSSFLRFCTGSDLFTGKNITVSFVHLQGFQRRPVAHTCGCFLELPDTYESYPDFRHEMNKVLESNIWVMDIV